MPTMPTIDRFDTPQLDVIGACPWCRSRRRAHLFDENGFPHVQCGECSLIYLAIRLKEGCLPLLYDDETYHAAADRAWIKRSGEKRLDLLGPLIPGSRIVEDGAGAGGFLAACLARGYRAKGCDCGADAIRAARAHFGIELHQGTMSSLGLPGASFEVVAAFNLLSHLYAPWDFLREARRLLVDDGRLILRTGLRDGVMKYSRRGRWSAPEHVFHSTRRSLTQMMESAGLEAVRIVPAFDSDYPYLLFDLSRAEGAPPSARRLAREVCGWSSLAWTLLGLPKDDAFIIARPRLNQEDR
jgi:SAM-dependent methyltransferase